MKNAAVLTEDGAFALFFPPHPGGFDSSRVPPPPLRNLPSKAKQMLMPGVSPEGGGLGAGGIDWCIKTLIVTLYGVVLHFEIIIIHASPVGEAFRQNITSNKHIHRAFFIAHNEPSDFPLQILGFVSLSHQILHIGPTLAHGLNAETGLRYPHTTKVIEIIQLALCLRRDPVCYPKSTDSSFSLRHWLSWSALV